MEIFFGYRKTSAAQWVSFKHCPSSFASRLVGERVVLQTAARKTRWYNGKEETNMWISLARTENLRSISAFFCKLQEYTVYNILMQNFHVTYLPADWGFSPPSPNKYGWLSNRTSQLVSLHQVDLLVSSHHTLPELLIPSPHRLNKTLVGQSECSHCEALDTLQLLVKLTHVWSLRSKCQHIERRNYVTPQKKGWIVGKKNVSFFLAGLIICLPQNTSGEGKKLKKLRTNIHTCFSFVILLGPPFWDGDRQVGKVVCRSYRIPMGFREVFVGTLHLIAKQKFNHPCRWEIYPSILGNLFIINPLPELFRPFIW